MNSRTPVFLVVLVIVSLSISANAQHLRFSTGHRDIKVPDYASWRIGPFYSNIEFRQSIGYRYSTTSTNVLDLLQGTRRGVMKDSGHEFPIVSTLSFKNYLPIARSMDLDSSFSIRYSHYPMGTQDDSFSVNFVEEGISADISFQMLPADWLRLNVYTRPSYLTDFVDLSGISDVFGGQKYVRFENTMGVDADWLLRKDMNVATSISRSDTIPEGSEFDDQRSADYSGSMAYEWEVNPLLVTGLRATAALSDYRDEDRDSYWQQTYGMFVNAEVTRNSTMSGIVGYSFASLESDVGTAMGSLSLSTTLTKDLSHSMTYSRSQAQGFKYGIDSVTSYGYNLSWDAEIAVVGFGSTMSSADTTDGKVAGYDVWQNEVRIAYPISDIAVLKYATTYATKRHGSITADDDEEVEVEFTGDYDTWMNTVEMSVPLSRDMTLSAYASYVTRDSDVSAMDYEWFIAGLNCEYSWGASL